MEEMKSIYSARIMCNDPEIGSRVYDYYNGALSIDEVPTFERHLIGCSYCERIVLELDKMLTILNEKSLAGGDVEFKPRASAYRPPTAIK